jgi:GxxExxY protein
MNDRHEPGYEPDEELDALARSVIGAAIEVHRTLGPGLLEGVYAKALCIELKLRHIPFAPEAVMPASYKGNSIGEIRLDLLVGNAHIVELKSVDELAQIHMAQLLSYLRLTGNKLGLLINFNVPVLKNGIRRVALSRQSRQ